MILKSKKIKIILMTILTFLILIAGKEVYGVVVNNPPVEPYIYDSNLFCIDHLKGWWVQSTKGLDGDSRVNEYTETEIPVEQSIGFAFYTASITKNWETPSLQAVIWSSGQFAGLPGYEKNLAGYDGQTTSSTSPNYIIARSNQYAQFYYGILQGGKDIPLSVTNSNTKVLVDQDTGTYTVGPYKVDVGASGGENVSEAKTILYNELSGANKKNYPRAPAFAAAQLTGIDGSDIEYLDQSGNKITFPNWGEIFYIRFKPAKGVTTIKPKLTIYYIPKIAGNIKYCTGSKGTFSGKIDGIYVKEDDFKPEDYVTDTTIKQNGNFGVSAEITITDVKTTTKKVATGGGDPIKDANGTITGYTPIQYTTYVTGFTYKAEVKDPTRLQELMYVDGSMHFDVPDIPDSWENLQAQVSSKVAKKEIELDSKDISMELGGNVWIDLKDMKDGLILGKKAEEDKSYAGMQVELLDKNGNVVAVTATDKNGSYHFKGLDPLMKYYVRFTYNGQLYQSTYYKYSLAANGGYSNAMDEAREDFNNKFASIDSTPQNYKIGSAWHKSFALTAKLAKDDGSYISYNGGALTYENAWDKFVELAANTGSYNSAYSQLRTWLRGLSVGATETEYVITFIQDCMITATTHIDDPLTGENKLIEYPVYNQFVLEDINNPTDSVETISVGKTYSYLYTKVSDQSRYVDYGITEREKQELVLQKDVYKATVIVNGKSQEYKYSKKQLDDSGSWSIELRAADELYNGAYSYSREVRPSEYLYDGSDVDSTDAKNLQVYVTYRIAIRNKSQSLNARINEVVDYYDAERYSFDGKSNNNGTYSINSYNSYDSNGNVTGTYINSYVGKNASGDKLSDIVVNNNTSFPDRTPSSTLSGDNYNYSSLYLTGIKSASGNDVLAPGEWAYAYVTFKANNDPATGKILLDEDLSTGQLTVGRRNIAEINGYSTFYRDGSVIPDYLDGSDKTVNKSVANKTAGIIDSFSNAGSLSKLDLTSDGDLIVDKDPVKNRAEMDTDKAPNIKIIITPTDDPRTFKGYTYEDARNITNDGAVVGDGKYADGTDTKINGVTVELVELVQNVDNNGIFLGSYSGERVWGTRKYKIENNTIIVDGTEDHTRYSSGTNTTKVILTGTGILKVDAKQLDESAGEYGFTSVPAGDFFIRFTYGDNVQTVLKSDDNEVNSLVGLKGLNAKSYNGQDFKTTTYQTEIDQNNTSYNGINGFTNYDNQNYNNGTDKAAMYYYDIARSANVVGASDAKDVYSYRTASNNWSMGANTKTLLNNRAEILNSFESNGTYKYATDEEQKNAQLAKLSTLAKETKMVAQTGVINTEVEYNTKTTENQGNDNKLGYIVNDIDLGLVERPESQLKLTKEITNLKLTLANNTTLFDTTKSVNNLYFAKHTGHTVTYDGFRLTGCAVSGNKTETPELVQAYLDEELMAQANIMVTYDLKVSNVGEVDYLDKQFYYTGKTANASIDNMSKTNANTVVDYISNAIKFDENLQFTESSWQRQSASDLTPSTTVDSENKLQIDASKIDNDLVNRQYADLIPNYESIMKTNRLSEELLPTIAKQGTSEKTTRLVVSTTLSKANADNYIYNNLAEIVETSNSQGRRMQYSVVGNQEMADQTLGNNASEKVLTKADLVTPSEIDADSAQKVVLLPPTGENKDYAPIIATTIIAAIAIIAGIVIIKKRI